MTDRYDFDVLPAGLSAAQIEAASHARVTNGDVLSRLNGDSPLITANSDGTPSDPPVFGWTDVLVGVLGLCIFAVFAVACTWFIVGNWPVLSRLAGA